MPGRIPHLPELAAEIARTGRTRRDIALEAGCHPNTLSSVINGFIRPTDDLRARIAAALDRDVDALFAERVAS